MTPGAGSAGLGKGGWSISDLTGYTVSGDSFQELLGWRGEHKALCARASKTPKT